MGIKRNSAHRAFKIVLETHTLPLIANVNHSLYRASHAPGSIKRKEIHTQLKGFHWIL